MKYGEGHLLGKGRLLQRIRYIKIVHFYGDDDNCIEMKIMLYTKLDKNEGDDMHLESLVDLLVIIQHVVYR